MANVSIKFNGKDFLLSCEDGQEASRGTIIQINQKFNILNDLGNLEKINFINNCCQGDG